MSRPEKRIRNGKVRWYARYYDPSGRQLAKTFNRQVDAERFLRQIETAKDNNNYVDPARGKIRMDAWSDKWLTTQGHLKPSTLARYRGIVAKWIKPRWGSTPLVKVQHEDVAEWISSIRLAPASVHYIHRVLYLILELAVRSKRISHNPAVGVRLPKKGSTDKRFLTREEVFRLADCAAEYPIPEIGEQYRVLVLVLAFCGLRWGEAAGLKVRRTCDFETSPIVVAETLTEVGGHLIWGTPKNIRQGRCRYLTSWSTCWLSTCRLERSLMIWSSPHGRQAVAQSQLASRRIRPAAADAGLAGLTPHEMRHTAASLAVSAGANVKAVQRMLGHASAAMTLDVYADCSMPI